MGRTRPPNCRESIKVWTDIPRARIAGKWLRKDEDALATAIPTERNSATIWGLFLMQESTQQRQ
jgi:hypothetical protein